MNVLGLHFGHDAAACVLRDGRIVSYVLRERHARIKHAISLDLATISRALAAAGITAEQVDFCAITSTQNMELIIEDPQGFAVEAKAHPGHRLPGSLDPDRAQAGLDGSLQLHSLMDIFYNPAHAKSFLRYHYGSAFPQHKSRGRADFTRFGMLDVFAEPASWSGGTLEELAVRDVSALLSGDGLRQGFHHPVTVRLGAAEIPAYLIGHHMAHAASCYYQSGFTDAAIFSHDGFAHGHGYLSGMFFRGEANRIYPVAPHHLAMGNLYNFIGTMLGLGYEGPAGKLMGLAGYGQPRFFDKRFVGNQYDWDKAAITPRAWLDHCLERARGLGYDTRFLGVASRVREPVNIDIAASTQALFEEIYLAAAGSLHRMLAGAGKDSANLCVTGGCALNCPSNSRLSRESAFTNVFIEPGCDDSGLAIGAAGWLYHNVLDEPLPPPVKPHASPYLGIAPEEDNIEAALAAVADRIEVQICDGAEAAAEDLAHDRVIGWFEGRSEIGPRALGHRSILADARAPNSDRVNAIKKREPWRPFAPAVLEEEAAAWFDGLPLPSPYMLFTGTVKSDALPAITHADHSARVQTVDPSCGDFYRLLKHFHARTGVPVILNTSFNGPGEPIVESAEDALRFFIGSGLDALYVGGRRITRR
jgi:carbamoyltransferase